MALCENAPYPLPKSARRPSHVPCSSKAGLMISPFLPECFQGRFRVMQALHARVLHSLTRFAPGLVSLGLCADFVLAKGNCTVPSKLATSAYSGFASDRSNFRVLDADDPAIAAAASATACVALRDGTAASRSARSRSASSSRSARQSAQRAVYVGTAHAASASLRAPKRRRTVPRADAGVVKHSASLKRIACSCRTVAWAMTRAAQSTGTQLSTRAPPSVLAGACQLPGSRESRALAQLHDAGDASRGDVVGLRGARRCLGRDEGRPPDGRAEAAHAGQLDKRLGRPLGLFVGEARRHGSTATTSTRGRRLLDPVFWQRIEAVQGIACSGRASLVGDTDGRDEMQHTGRLGGGGVGTRAARCGGPAHASRADTGVAASGSAAEQEGKGCGRNPAAKRRTWRVASTLGARRSASDAAKLDHAAQ